MNFKSKIKSLIVVTLLSMGLIACDNNSDYSGDYKNERSTYSFKKLTSDEYELTRYSDGEYRGSQTVLIKENTVLRPFDKKFIGKIDGNKFIYKGDERSVFIKK